MRVAFTPDLGYLQVEKPVAEAMAKAIPILKSIGCLVENDHPDVVDAFWTHKVLRGVLTATATEPFFDAQRSQIKPTMIWDVEGGRKLSALDVSHAEAKAAQFTNRSANFWGHTNF